MTEGQALVGTTIAGKYKIRRLVGTGGMGAVYEGQHVDLAKRVAVKIIDSAAVMSAELTTRFKREARAASAVESEGIVQVFDVGRDPDVGLYMVMEFLQGEDLEIRLRKSPGRRLDAVVVAQIGHQVARALVKAHGARVIHRDLKPANIFLTERDDGSLRVKVLDFGISKLLMSEASIASKEGLLDLTAAGVALGTPQYMSPEQAQGLTTVDHRTDVWGLGVVLYEALAGQPAYPELRSYQETIMKILTERPPPLAKVAPWVPAELAKVVHEAIEHDVAKRIQDCAILAQRIASACPESVMGSTGPFHAVRALAKSGSMPGVSMPVAGGPPQTPMPSTPLPSTAADPHRPITLGNDTQVVVRPSDPAAFDDNSPSATMMADSVPSTTKDAPPKVVVHDGPRTVPGAPPVLTPGVAWKPGSPAAQSGEEEAPMSTGDPTMFQQPAWVEPEGDRPTTMKSGVAIEPRAKESRGTRPLHGALAAAATAIVVVGVGVAVIALTQRESGSSASTPSAGAGNANVVNAAQPAAEPPPEGTTPPPSASQEMMAPAPPATGTAAVPEKVDGGD